MNTPLTTTFPTVDSTLASRRVFSVDIFSYLHVTRKTSSGTNVNMSTLKSQSEYDVIITTTEMHTGGEPVRIIESGYPVPQGGTILDKIEDLKKNHDDFRKFVIYEPRGHYDMYGVIMVTPDLPTADIGVIFIHNEGYSTMCGHACISLGRYAVDRGLLRGPVTSPHTTVNIQTPCGVVSAQVQVDMSSGVPRTGRVQIESVPSFVVQTDVELAVPGLGKVKVDIVYGGAFYAFVTAKDVGVDFATTKNPEVKAIAAKIKGIAKDKVKLSHPETPAFLYGVIFIDSRDTKTEGPATNICIFADNETDRSPCGSGTTARVALMFHRGLLALGESHVFRSGVTGSEFIASPSKQTEVDGVKAVTVKVEGRGYYSGRNTLMLERGDEFGRGFLVR